MILSTYSNPYLAIQNEQNEVIGLLNAKKEVEPALLLCLQSEYGCDIKIIKSEEPDSMGMAFFTVECLEEGADEPYTREISVAPAWLFEEKEQ